MSQAAALAQKLIKARPILRFLGAVCVGLVAALGQAPWELWPLTIAALALLYGLYLSTATWRQATMLGLSAGIGYFALALNWIVEPFFVDFARHGWMAPFAIVLLSIGMGLFWAVPFGIARRFGGGALPWIAGLVLFEVLRGTLFTGFPWAQIGHVLIASPLLHWASWGGALLLILIVLGASVILWHFISDNRTFGALGILVFGALYGGGLALKPNAAAGPDAPIVRIVQPNAPQHEKWDPEMIPVFFKRQVDFTAASGDQGRPDLIVWPETAIPYMLDNAGPALDIIHRAAAGTPVVLGLRRNEGRRFFNSLIYLDEAGQISAQYDKHHLVPFGEYMPFGDTLSRWGISGLAASNGSGFSAGPGPELVDIGELGSALPLICYEGVFARNLLAAPERAEMLLMITNDAWFGQASGPYQHLAQARLRSVEQGLPMIRAANTGVSAMIDGAGDLSGSIALGEAGFLDLALPPPLPETLYARVGDGPIILFASTLMLLSFISARKQRAAS